MVARYGPRSEPGLEAVSQRILKHYRRIAPHATEPSLLLVQAPIFHGHAFSIYVEMEKAVALGDFAQALTGEHIVVAGDPEEVPNNASAAGQGDILVSLTRDANRENGIWIWAATDNLRIAALHRGGMRRNPDRIAPAGTDSMRLWTAAVALLLSLTAGCGYHTVGHVVTCAQNVRTIAIPGFVSHSPTFRVEQVMTDAVVREFNTRTQFHVIHEAQAGGCRAHGTVVSATTTPLAYDSKTGRAASVLVTVSMQVTLTDHDGKVLFQNPAYLFHEQYELSRELSSFFEEDSPAMDRLSRDLLGRWLRISWRATDAWVCPV